MPEENSVFNTKSRFKRYFLKASLINISNLIPTNYAEKTHSPTTTASHNCTAMPITITLLCPRHVINQPFQLQWGKRKLLSNCGPLNNRKYCKSFAHNRLTVARLPSHLGGTRKNRRRKESRDNDLLVNRNCHCSSPPTKSMPRWWWFFVFASVRTIKNGTFYIFKHGKYYTESL